MTAAKAAKGCRPSGAKRGVKALPPGLVAWQRAKKAGKTPADCKAAAAAAGKKAKKAA